MISTETVIPPFWAYDQLNVTMQRGLVSNEIHIDGVVPCHSIGHLHKYSSFNNGFSVYGSISFRYILKDYLLKCV